MTSQKALIPRLIRPLCAAIHLPKGDGPCAQRLPRKSTSIGSTCRGTVRCIVANKLKSKIVCVDSSRDYPRSCAIWTPQNGRKGECCVCSVAKINVLFRLGAFFDEKLSFFFVIAYRKTVTFLRVSSPFITIFSAFFISILNVSHLTFSPILRTFGKKMSVFSPSAGTRFVLVVVRATATTRSPPRARNARTQRVFVFQPSSREFSPAID